MDIILGGRYQLIKKIGSGGMSIVYLAKDLSLDRNVAIKVLRDEFTEDNDFRRHFQKEAVAIAKLSHQNIVGIYDILVENDKMCLVMEYIEGRTLKDRLNQEGPIAWKQVVKYGIQIANGLAYAHSQQIIHKDIKSQNILLDKNDNTKITDFGISQMLNNTTITHNKGILGSAHYFSPEQARGEKLSYQTDIYSLGVVLYELLTGNLPFTGDNPVSVALKHIQEQPKPVSLVIDGIPEALSDIVQKCLAKKPEMRFHSMHELSMALSSISDISPKKKSSMKSDNHLAAPIYKVSSKEAPVFDKRQNQAANSKFHSIKEKKKPPKLLFLLGLVVAVLLLTLFISQYVIPPSEINVPNLIGMNIDDANEKAKKMDINIQISSTEYNDVYEEGEIIDQSPKSGTNIKRGDTITVIVSKGTEQIKIPSLVNKTLEEAKEELEKNHLNLGNVTESYSDTVAKGRIISQSQEAGEKVDRETSIDLEVSLGEASYAIVPNLIGVSIDKAKDMLKTAKLQLGDISYQDSQEANNSIIKQSYTSGTKVDENTRIDLVVSSGPREKDEDHDTNNETQKTKQISVNIPRDGLLTIELNDDNGSNFVYLGRVNGGTNFNQTFSYYGNAKFIVKLDDKIIDTINGD